jgi:hypothetical protein
MAAADNQIEKMQEKLTVLRDEVGILIAHQKKIELDLTDKELQRSAVFEQLVAERTKFEPSIPLHTLQKRLRNKDEAVRVRLLALQTVDGKIKECNTISVCTLYFDS